MDRYVCVGVFSILPLRETLLSFKAEEPDVVAEKNESKKASKAAKKAAKAKEAEAAKQNRQQQQYQQKLKPWQQKPKRRQQSL